MKAINAREAAPEKALLRDYIDARFNLGEFLLPSLVVILALTFLSQSIPRVSVISTGVMYLFLLGVIADSALMWRGFKKLLAVRVPKASTRGTADVRGQPRHPDPPVPDAGAAGQARGVVLRRSR